MQTTIKITEDQNAKQALLEGFRKVNDAVAITLGPKGRNVVIHRRKDDIPTITKDGVSVAREIAGETMEEDAGVQLIKSVASRTARFAGDGTSTATVIAYALAKESLKYTSSNSNVSLLFKGITYGTQLILKELEKYRKPVEKLKDIINIATISANNDKEIGLLIGKTMDKIGQFGSISIEESQNFTSSVTMVNGFKFDKGYASPKFINDMGSRIVLKKPIFYITNKKLTSFSGTELSAIMEYAYDNKHPLVVIAEDIVGDALGYLLANNTAGKVPAVAIKAPSFGDTRNEILTNLAINVGAKFFDINSGDSLTDDPAQFGGAEKVIVTRNETIIMEGYGTDMEKNSRIKILKHLKDESKIDHDKDKYTEQIASMLGKVAILHVGAFSEVELKEKKDRVEDAVKATYAAMEEGIIPGSGIALYRSADVIMDEILSGNLLKDENTDIKTGVHLACHAAKKPFEMILQNCDIKPDLIYAKIKGKSLSFGYDAFNEKFCNLISSGIIDPFKVARTALENATSISGAFMTTQCIIAYEQEDKGQQIPFLPGMM